jgi:citrate synthase
MITLDPELKSLGSLRDRNYERTLFREWFEKWPSHQSNVSFQVKLSEHAFVDEGVWNTLESYFRETEQFNYLSYPDFWNTFNQKNFKYSNMEEAVQLFSPWFGVFAALERKSEGKSAIYPKRNFSVAQNFLYMYKGQIPAIQESGAFDNLLTMYTIRESGQSQFFNAFYDLPQAIAKVFQNLQYNKEYENFLHLYAALYGLKASSIDLNSPVIQDITKRGFSDHPELFIEKIDNHAFEIGKESSELQWYKIVKRLEMMQQKYDLYPRAELYVACIFLNLQFPPTLFRIIKALSQVSQTIKYYIAK